MPDLPQVNVSAHPISHSLQKTKVDMTVINYSVIDLSDWVSRLSLSLSLTLCMSMCVSVYTCRCKYRAKDNHKCYLGIFYFFFLAGSFINLELAK